MSDLTIREQTSTFSDLQFLDPAEVISSLTNLDDATLEDVLLPLAGRLVESPELAAHFIDQIIEEAINLGADLNPALAALLQVRLGQMQVTPENLDEILNTLSNNQPELIHIFRGLDTEVQRQMGAFYVYLQINRGISADDYFQIARKLNLPKLPKELWDVRRFGVSNTGIMNTEVPATLDYTVYGNPKEA